MENKYNVKEDLCREDKLVYGYALKEIVIKSYSKLLHRLSLWAGLLRTRESGEYIANCEKASNVCSLCLPVFSCNVAAALFSLTDSLNLAI